MTIPYSVGITPHIPVAINVTSTDAQKAAEDAARDLKAKTEEARVQAE